MSSEPLSILYQDEWMVAVNKPAGQLVHPAENPQDGDEVTMKILRDQIGQRVNVIHRLDRPTSGVLVFGLEKAAARGLHQAFEKHHVDKTYWAVVTGHPESERWICRRGIRKDEEKPERWAETVFQVLSCLEHDVCLVEAMPKTGRFHQIRRHLLAAGHPIVGDYRYLGEESCDALGGKLGTGTRMLLQAKSLRLVHPVTNVELLIEAPVDPAIETCLRGGKA